MYQNKPKKGYRILTTSKVNKIYWLTLWLVGMVSIASFSQGKPISDTPYLPGTIIVKSRVTLDIRDKNSFTSRLGLRQLSGVDIASIKPTLPWIQQSIQSGRIASHPLATVYTLKVDDSIDLEKAIDILLQSDLVEYAEPYYLYRPLLIPNDPGVSGQYYLDLIRAYDAWNIEQGDTTITIAMLDTGLDYTHEDMAGSIQYNVKDPINGIDDDGDGLIDNYYGWDLANNDNIPLDDTNIHGTTVAGVSSASVNNNKGIAGVGFKTRVLPFKIFMSGSNVFWQGYEAIALAADLGCQVINLSWGEAGAYSAFGEDVIRYAVMEKDAAVIAAAGNTNGNLNFYPASYPNVLSVGATDPNDVKTTWGAYSPYIDLMAPGNNIATIGGPNSYTTGTGTSLSAPMVAAAVALVRARFPELNARQAMERVRVNADNILSNQGSNPWAPFIGKGRLNIFAALTNITSPAVRIKDFTYFNGFGPQAYFKDTVSLTMAFENLLYPVAGLSIEISSTSPYVNFLNNEVSLPSLKTLEIKNNAQSPFQLVLSENTPPNQHILLKLTYSAGTYTDHEYIEFTTSPTWATIDNGISALTVASNGNLGYANNLKNNGVGFTYSDELVLENSGLLIRSGQLVMDNIPVRLSQFSREEDFSVVRSLRPSKITTADFYYDSKFQVKNDLTPALPLTIEQKILSWEGVPAMVIEYFVTNFSDTMLTDFQPGFLADFDINNSLENRNSQDGKIQYTWDETLNLYGGMEVLTGNDYHMIAIDKRNLQGNSSDVPPYLSDADKHALFFIEKTAAGLAGTGNDVAGLATIPAIDLEAKGQIRFAIVLTTAESLSSLTSVHETIRERYAQFRESPPIGLISKYCPGEDAFIDPPGTFTRIFNDPQATDLVFEGDHFTLFSPQGKQKLFGIDITNNIPGDIYSILVKPALLQTDFSMTPDILLLDESGSSKVTFQDQSNDAVTWLWNFSNGYSSTKASPSVNFSEPGEYTVTLQTTNELGCSDQTQKQLTVARRNQQLPASELTGCPGDIFVINPDLADSIHVYTDVKLTQRIYAGKEFVTTAVFRDTILYVTNLDGPYESLPAPLTISIDEVYSTFTAQPDTTFPDKKFLLKISSKPQENVFLQWELWGTNAEPTPLGNDPILLVDYEGLDNFRISLTATNGAGCSVRTERSFSPKVSPTPYLSEIQACPGESVQVVPEGGTTFHFYRDSELSNLVHKGSSMLVDNILNDTIFYVVSIDSLLESLPVTVDIKVSTLEANFEIPDSPVDLNTTSTITLEDASFGSVITRVWRIDGEFAGNSSPITLDITEAGTKNISLEVTDAIGCISILEKTVEIVVITDIDIRDKILFPYPNPASTYINISGNAGTLVLLDYNGRIVRECTECTSLSLLGLPAGFYILRLTENNNLLQAPVVIRN